MAQLDPEFERLRRQEGADTGGLSRRGPALPGPRGYPASETAKMCLVTGPLPGELRSPSGWDPEPLLCHRRPWPHDLRGLQHGSLAPLGRLRVILCEVISSSIESPSDSLARKPSPQVGGWRRSLSAQCTRMPRRAAAEPGLAPLVKVRSRGLCGRSRRRLGLLSFCPVAHAVCVALASVTVAGWLSRRPSVGPFLLYSVQTLPRRGQGTSWSCRSVAQLLFFPLGGFVFGFSVSELQFQNV